MKTFHNPISNTLFGNLIIELYLMNQPWYRLLKFNLISVHCDMCYMNAGRENGLVF